MTVGMTVVTVLVAFLTAVLSGLGVGSAGLMMLFLTAVLHLPQLEAQGINLFYFLFSSGASLVVQFFRTAVLPGCVFFLLPFGVLGALLGFRLAVFLPGALLRRLFGGILVLFGGIGLFSKSPSKKLKKPPR